MGFALREGKIPKTFPGLKYLGSPWTGVGVDRDLQRIIWFIPFPSLPKIILLKKKKLFKMNMKEIQKSQKRTPTSCCYDLG